MKYYAFIIILACRLVYHPATSGTLTAFSEPSTARFLSFNGTVNDRKVVLQWSIGENQTADRFQVEKSMDGKTFHVAALAFGSDKPGMFSYEFYEKVGKEKVSYRIKLINKDSGSAYSKIVTIRPSV
jgi:hypothetical protein